MLSDGMYYWPALEPDLWNTQFLLDILSALITIFLSYLQFRNMKIIP